MPALQNQVVDEMFDLSNESLPDEEIARVWKKIDPESLLRLFLVEFISVMQMQSRCWLPRSKLG